MLVLKLINVNIVTNSLEFNYIEFFYGKKSTQAYYPIAGNKRSRSSSDNYGKGNCK
ncbi:hypothetical protein GCM10028806_14130 [Spirosoma terrae]